ncbi:MAG TPA: hypothetical protein VEV38_13565 [Candidatus Eremiobacteraceae bacterium]|nr:hypothetical protein [Candidatus Eremiobacteraceae bacterium]
MSSANVVTATFTLTRNATAAVDWFLNQSIDRDAVSIRVASKGEQPRSPRAGDNRRADLTWSVSVDLSRARLNKRIVVETMKREGGKL